jgi:hypothetical protein
MAVDFSWEHAVSQYLQIYRNIGAYIGTATPPEPPVSPSTSIEAPVVQEIPPNLVKTGKASKAKSTTVESAPIAPDPTPVITDAPKPATKTTAKPKSLDALKENKTRRDTQTETRRRIRTPRTPSHHRHGHQTARHTS